MKLRILMLPVLLVLMSTSIKASQPDPMWKIQPGECVVSKQQEFCETTVTVTLLNASYSDACVFAEKQWIGCFSDVENSIRFPVIIKSDFLINLQGSNKDTIASYTIEYRLINSTPLRRRIRLPWSVF